MADFEFKLPKESGTCGQLLAVNQDFSVGFINESQLDDSPQDTIKRLKRRIEVLESEFNKNTEW